MKKGLVMICFVATVVTGCDSLTKQQSGEKYRGREETKKLEGASAVGYDGTAIRKNVDNSLNKNDDHNQDLDKALKTGEAKQ